MTDADIATRIRASLRLAPVPSLPDFRLYTAHPASRVSQFETSGEPPYWAYLWAGGLALAHHFAAHPDVVGGRRVLDLGAGSGLVAIAAAKAGAGAVRAAETDANGAAAIALNAAANGIHLDIVTQDLLDGPAPPVDIVAVGDLFYAPGLAARVMAFLTRCQSAGLDVLIGDPGRADLPTHHLSLIATYDVADFGRASEADRILGQVFRLDDRTSGDGVAEP